MIRITDIKKLKPLGSSIETLTHRFVQKCSVSGTSKGKGKDGQVLKKSKVNIKKGQPKADPAEKKKQVDDCQPAKPPVRYLKPKERQREAEREKMGLISEARKLEIENFKKNKGKTDFDEPGIIGPEGYDLISLGLVDADKIPKYGFTAEDGARLAKEYSRVLMRQHNARKAAESSSLKCKKAAINALPKTLRAAALVPDLTPFPAERMMPTLTPPIEGYAEMLKEEAKRQSTVKGKLR